MAQTTETTTMNERDNWPAWMHSAWERDWNAPCSIQPALDGSGNYEARNGRGVVTHFTRDDCVTIEMVL